MTKKLSTGVQNIRKRDHNTACMSHRRLPIMDSGRRVMIRTMHVPKQTLNVVIKLPRLDPLLLRVLLPKESPLTQKSTISN